MRNNSIFVYEVINLNNEEKEKLNQDQDEKAEEKGEQIQEEKDEDKGTPEPTEPPKDDTEPDKPQDNDRENADLASKIDGLTKDVGSVLDMCTTIMSIVKDAKADEKADEPAAEDNLGDFESLI